MHLLKNIIPLDMRLGVRAPLWSPCCVLEQDIFTPQKILVIPRKGWLRPSMTEKLFTGTLSSKPNQTKTSEYAHFPRPIGRKLSYSKWIVHSKKLVVGYKFHKFHVGCKFSAVL